MNPYYSKYPDAVFRGSLHILETVIQLSKGEDQPNKEIVDVLSQSVLDKLAAVLSESIAASKKKTHSGATEIKKLREELQKILLYKTIFAEELARKTAALKQSAEPSQEEAEMADKLAEAESGKSTEEGALREEEASSAEQSNEEGSKLITLNAESVLKGFDRRFPAEGTYHPSIIHGVTHIISHEHSLCSLYASCIGCDFDGCVAVNSQQD